MQGNFGDSEENYFIHISNNNLEADLQLMEYAVWLSYTYKIQLTGNVCCLEIKKKKTMRND